VNKFYIVLLHVSLEYFGIELLHSVVDKWKHRCAGLEPEAIDKAFAWLETSRERDIKLLSFLTGHLGCKVEHLVACLSINEVVESHKLHDSFSVVLGSEQGIFFLDDSHLIVELYIVSYNTDTSIDTSLNLDCTKAEHCQSWARMTGVFWTSKWLSHILKNVNVTLLQEGHNWGDIIAYTVQVSEQHCLGL